MASLALAPFSVVCLAIANFSVVWLAIAPFSSRSLATPAVRGRVLTGGSSYYSDCVSFNYVSSRFSCLRSQAVQRCGSGF